MQVSDFLFVAGLSCIILHCSVLGQNNEVSSRNPAIAHDGKVTVNFGDLVIEVKPPHGREDIVNTQTIYERWENVDDVTYWESIYGSMDNIPAFEDLPDIPGETIELQYAKKWDEEDPEERLTEITNNYQSGISIKNSSGRDDRSTSSTTDLEMTTKSSIPDRCEKINPLLPTLKLCNRQKREISVSQEEEADAEEALKSDPNRKRKSRTLSLLHSSTGKSRLKYNWSSDYLFNKYGRKSFRPYKYERRIPKSSVDDCDDDYGITGAATSAKFVDSAINTVELVNSGIAKTSQVVTDTIVNGAKQLAQAKHDAIDLGQEATQTIALGSLNNATADCTVKGVAAVVATNIDSGLEVVGNSVLDTKSGIINASKDPSTSVGITASLDARTKAGVDTFVGSVLDNDATVGAEIISNAVTESNITITGNKDVPKKIAIAENERKSDLQEAKIVGETLVTKEIIGKTLDAKGIIGGTLGNKEIVGGTLVPEEIVGNTTIVKTPVLQSGIAKSAQVAGAVEVVSDSEKFVGSALKVNVESEVHKALNAEISTGAKAKVKTVKNHKKGPRVLKSPDLSCECTNSSEDDRDRKFCVRHRYYDKFDDEQEYRQRFPDRGRYRPNSQHYYGRFRSGGHADAGIGVTSNRGSISAATAASADADANLDIGSSRSGIHSDAGVHSDHRSSGLHAGGQSSLGIDSYLDIGRSRSNYRTYDYNREHLTHSEERDSVEDIFDFDSEEYREFKRRFPDTRPREHPINSGIHADTGIRKSLNIGIGKNANHGSIQTGTAASLSIDTNLDAAISKSSGIHAKSGTQTSLDAGLDINSGLHAGAKSSLDIDSHVNIGHSELRTLERNKIYGDFNRNEDVCECEDSEGYKEYHRRYPGSRFRPDNHGHQNSETHANAGIHTSLDSSIDVKTGLHGGGASSRVHSSSGIHGSLDAGVGLNSNSAGSHLHAGSKASLDAKSRLDVGRMSSDKPHGKYRGYQRGDDIYAEYDDYNDEREHERFLTSRYRDGQRDVHSGIHAASGIHGSVGTGISKNVGSAGGLQAGAKASLNLDSHLDIGTKTSAVNDANSRHSPHVINSAIRADAGIHTSLDTDINAAGHLHSGIKSSLAVDSHLDVGTRTNGDSGSRPTSEIIGDVNGPDGELGEKICEAACRGNSDFRKHDSCPHARFQPAGRDGPSYICDNCRRRLHSEANRFYSNGGEQDHVFGERLPFLSSGTIYHFGSLKQNCKRTADSSEDIELHPETTCGLKRYINLDANCSDKAFQQSPDCQNLDYNMEMPRDGNSVSLGIVRNHLSHGHDIALDMHDRARSLVAGGLHPYPHTASMLHFFHSKVPDDLVKLNEESELTLFGTKLLQHKLSVDHNITPNNFLEFLNHHEFRVTGDRICRGRRKRCSGYNKFRSFDGSCNNVAHPTWGQSNRAFARILPARYSDGIHGMPMSVTGAELPNPRKLSVRLYSRSTKLDPELTLTVMQWGQILAHDLGRQVMDQTTDGGIECCADNGKRHLPKSLQHHSCAPITISPRDKFYSIHGQRCMNFVRAMTVCREDCTLGPADQLNGATSFLDCSSMYSPDKPNSDELREFSGGRMKVEFRNGRWMLPTTTNQSNFCDIWNSDDVCYRTGDPRNNQNPQLVILQTMLVREHNRIADALKALNSGWNDERIFQESRRIVIAEYQHITYNEWLPLLLGKRYVKKHGLNRSEREMSSAYNERLNPTTIIGFTSGAFRSLHSMVEGDIGLCNVRGEMIDSLKLSDHFFRPKVIEERNNFEHLLRGLSSQRMQAQDMNLHRELTEYLFRSRNDYGMDLAAIDIQRGRDHGVPSYNAYRKICRLEPATDFYDLSDEISWENIEKLRRDYAHVDDIDLIVGATMENRTPGSLFGPTNCCLIGEQFYRSRVGDRYFYDNANLPHSFTPEQYHEITKVTLSRLMCDTGGAVVMVQRNAFRVISPKNPLIPCEDLPKLDLTLWRE